MSILVSIEHLGAAVVGEVGEIVRDSAGGGRFVSELEQVLEGTLDGASAGGSGGAGREVAKIARDVPPVVTDPL